MVDVAKARREYEALCELEERVRKDHDAAMGASAALRAAWVFYERAPDRLRGKAREMLESLEQQRPNGAEVRIARRRLEITLVSVQVALENLCEAMGVRSDFEEAMQ